MDPFKVMLLEISEKLGQDHLAKLKFLCGDVIGKKKMEQITSGVQLFECLIEKVKIGPDDTEFLRKLLSDIGQDVLLAIVDRYEGQTIPKHLPDKPELVKINCAIEVIVEQLGRKWIQYGRSLGVSEAKLQGIQEKHPRNLEEQVRELFNVWLKMRKAEARVDDLITALRACSLNYTADLVARELQNTKS